MSRQWKCPYFNAFENRTAVQCAVARIKFTEADTWTDFCDSYCDNVDGFEKCSIYKVLEREYYRLDEQKKPLPKYQQE